MNKPSLVKWAGGGSIGNRVYALSLSAILLLWRVALVAASSSVVFMQYTLTFTDFVGCRAAHTFYLGFIHIDPLAYLFCSRRMGALLRQLDLIQNAMHRF